MKKYIEIKAPQHRVFDYIDPEKAFENIVEVNPDVIFLDLNMPVMDGWDFLKAMAAHNFSHKVAILTSSTSQEDLEESNNYQNVKGFFVKPFDAEELAKVLDTI